MRPQMSSSHWAESAPKKKFVVVSSRHIGRDPRRGQGVATAGYVEVVADLREELRARHPDLGARFLYAGGGDLHVVVAGERFLDEVLQDGSSNTSHHGRSASDAASVADWPRNVGTSVTGGRL